MRNRNCVIWVTLDVSEHFLCPLLAWNKNAQLEQGGGARLPCSQSCWGGQFQPQHSPPGPPPAAPKAASSIAPEDQLAKT